MNDGRGRDGRQGDIPPDEIGVTEIVIPHPEGLDGNLVAGTCFGYLAVAGGTRNDTIDASAVTNTATAFFGGAGGTDGFVGGNGKDDMAIQLTGLSGTLQGSNFY